MVPLVGGNLSKWKFSRTYNGAHGSAELEKDQYLAIEVKPDYYLTFAVPTDGTSMPSRILTRITRSVLPIS